MERGAPRKPGGRGRPFQKGQSGNPGGRAKEAPKIRALARAHGVEAIERLVEIMRGRDVRCALLAAQTLLDRGFDKVVQGVAVSGDGQGGPILLSGLGPVYGIHAPAET